jgi:hypothetical protein
MIVGMNEGMFDGTGDDGVFYPENSERKFYNFRLGFKMMK